MPFMDRRRPSIQLGLLKATAVAAGIDLQTLHANLDLAAMVGDDLYDRLAEHRGRMVGDWLFSLEAFGDAAPDPDSTFPIEFEHDLGYLAADLVEIRREIIPAYLDSIVEDHPWDETKIVGFTSTFQQNTASFALARRLKARWPDLVTIFGGANFDGEMGLEWVRTVDCIDYAVIGEGDHAFPALLDALRNGSDPRAVPGVVHRGHAAVFATPPAPLLRSLDELPDPDYDEYFERAERLGLMTANQRRSTWIPFESSRGCWWGEKHHCTFCGLNGTSMAFRAKSADRVVDELARQAQRYGSFHFEAVDNILDLDYLDNLLPVLHDTRTDYEIFYELKANLTRAQVRALADAGVGRIQPGIESLSSHVLQLMRKGVRAAQNVNVLRWASYYGIAVEWNVIWGFPGETQADYTEQAEVMLHLLHLQPPSGAGRIWLERFSPLFTESAAFGVRGTPERSYRFVYPGDVDLDRAAYFFEHEADDELPPTAYEPLIKALSGWSGLWHDGVGPVLRSRSSPGYLQIYDTRDADKVGTYTFRGELADIYAACMDRPRSAAAVVQELELRRTVGSVESIFAEFQQRGLMFRDGDWTLSLAIPAVRGR
jgi:ribosomal peptide maturation radical SAM protein 1